MTITSKKKKKKKLDNFTGSIAHGRIQHRCYDKTIKKLKVKIKQLNF